MWPRASAIAANGGIHDNELVLGCVSRLHPSKRNDVIIDALAHLSQEVRLVFAPQAIEGRRSRAACERGTSGPHAGTSAL